MSIGVKHIYVEDETSFYIKNSKPEDSGKYTCVGQTMTLTVYTVYTVTVEPATKKGMRKFLSPLRHKFILPKANGCNSENMYNHYLAT